jgi:S-adenosylmethionine synthetase
MTTIAQALSNYNPYLRATENAAASNADEAVSASLSAPQDTPSSLASGVSDFGGDLEARVAAMVISHATKNRKQATEQRDAVEKQISENERRQISEMHHSANVLREQAKIDLTLNLTSAGLSTAGGVAGQTKTGAILTGSSKTLDAATKYVDAQYGALQKEIDAKKTVAQQAADAAKRSLDDIKDAKHGADNLEDRAINFLTTATQTRADTERAMIFRG